MKKGSKILKINILILAFFVGIHNILAVTVTTSEYFSGNTAVKKIMNGQNAYCLDGALDAPKVGAEYTLVNQSDDNNLYYAYIINSISTGTISSETDWYNAEHALHQFISGTAASSDIQQAVNDAKGIKNGTSKITSNPSTLTFTKSNNKYVANTTISGKAFTLGTCALDQGTVNHGGTISIADVDSNSKKITVSVPINNLTDDLNVTLTCSNNYQTYYTTKVYSCTSNCISIKTNQEANVQRLAIKEKVDVNEDVVVRGTVVVDKKGSITIKKQGKNSQGVKKNLPGVKFIIKNSKGKTINASGQEEANYEFTTGSDGTIKVTNIELSNNASENVYTVEEIETLTGYARSTKKITVTLSEENPSFSQTVVNDTVQVTISKTDATGKKELPGAKLSLVDKNGKVLKKCVFDNEKSLITYSNGDDAKECTWASTDTQKILEGLPVGKYYLIEELAPEGYSKSSEKIEIEIKDTGAVKDKIVMKNSLKVPVPDTLSARSALLLAVAMFDVALGIGIVLYVKKNKVEE